MCLATHPTNPDLFFSGGRDNAVIMWDRRVRRSAGTYQHQAGLNAETRPSLPCKAISNSTSGLFGASVDGGLVVAHQGMVACLVSKLGRSRSID